MYILKQQHYHRFEFSLIPAWKWIAAQAAQRLRDSFPLVEQSERYANVLYSFPHSTISTWRFSTHAVPLTQLNRDIRNESLDVVTVSLLSKWAVAEHTHSQLTITVYPSSYWSQYYIWIGYNRITGVTIRPRKPSNAGVSVTWVKGALGRSKKKL